MLCIRCGSEIPKTRKSVKYCSNRCSKLYLGAKYRKKYRDKINEYHRQYRKGIRRGVLKGSNVRKFERNGVTEKVGDMVCCYFCNKRTDLEWHHISYDSPIIVVRLCRSCHRKLHRLLKYKKMSEEISKR